MPNQTALQPELWIDRHADVLFRYAYARVRETVLAEDLVQETFLAALQNRASFAGQSSERTWLYGILKHRIADQFRQSAGRVSSVGEARQIESVDSLFSKSGKWKHAPAEWSNPERSFEQAEFWDAFHRCVSGLPPRLVAALTLRDIDGIQSDEVCKILGVSATNLWTLLHRARTRLRTCLERNWFDVRG